MQHNESQQCGGRKFRFENPRHTRAEVATARTSKEQTLGSVFVISNYKRLTNPCGLVVKDVALQSPRLLGSRFRISLRARILVCCVY